jgi:hypothetical protein
MALSDMVLEIIAHLDDLPPDHEPEVSNLWEALRYIEKLCVEEDD